MDVRLLLSYFSDNRSPIPRSAVAPRVSRSQLAHLDSYLSLPVVLSLSYQLQIKL